VVETAAKGCATKPACVAAHVGHTGEEGYGLEAHWNVWSDAKSEKNARHVAKWLISELARPVEQLTFGPYPKTGGWTFSFQMRLSGASWNDQIVDLIALGQRVAHGWILTGDISRDPQGWSNDARVTGVTSIQWQIWPADEVDNA
jgi:hypothetical protein